MSKSKIFFVLSVSFLAGVFAASFFQPKTDPPLLADDGCKSIFLILAVIGIFIIILNHKSKKNWIVLVAILFLALGMWRTNISLENAKDNLANQELGPAEFVGTVSKEPEIDETNQKIVVEDEEKNKILVNADAFPSYAYGDELKMKCILQAPRNHEDSKFDYQMYLAKDGIYRICNKTQITAVAKNKGNKVYAAILTAKNKFEEKISRVFPDPEGAYLKGLLLGGGKRLPDRISDAFSRTGTTHTVAVSGYNVTIVAAFLMGLGIFLGLWRQQVFFFALIGIVFFVLMTGAPSSAVRAGIMGSLVIWAMKEGRLANSTNAILLAGALMLAINPLLLRYDAGFQLSFLATLGIVYVYPLFEKNFFAGEQNILKETILMTMAAQVFVLPVILANFENLSVISPLANLLILPAIPYIMGMGFAAGIAGFIAAPLGTLVGFVPYVLLKLELSVVQWLANISWASLEIKNFGWMHMTVYYFILISLLYFHQRKSRIMERNEK